MALQAAASWPEAAKHISEGYAVTGIACFETARGIGYILISPVYRTFSMLSFAHWENFPVSTSLNQVLFQYA